MAEMQLLTLMSGRMQVRTLTRMQTFQKQAAQKQAAQKQANQKRTSSIGRMRESWIDQMEWYLVELNLQAWLARASREGNSATAWRPASMPREGHYVFC